MCISGLDKLNLTWRFDFWLKPSFAICLAAPKKILFTYKVVKSVLSSLTKVRSESLIHTILEMSLIFGLFLFYLSVFSVFSPYHAI